MTAAAKKGAMSVLAAIEEAEKASRWAFDSLRVDRTSGAISLIVARAGETRSVALSPRQAEWMAQVVGSELGGFTLRAHPPDGVLHVDITNEGHAILTIGHDTPKGGREIQIPRSLGSVFLSAARDARAVVQLAKDGAR